MAPPVTIDNTLGALLIGFAVSCCLFGVVIAQVSSYYSRFHADKLIYKVLVIVIFTCQLLDQALIGHVVYFYIITNFLNPLALIRGSVTWSFILQQTLGAIVGTVVTTCYAIRVWRFSHKNWYISGILVALSMGHLASAIVFTVQAFQLPTVEAVSGLRVIGTIALGLGSATDISTAAALCAFLVRLRTGHEQSDTLVKRLMCYALSTGAATSVVSITCLVLYNIMPDNLIFIGVFFALSKFYAISFMATLNTRRIVRGRGTDRQHLTSGSGSGFESSNNHLRHSLQSGWHRYSSRAAIPITRQDISTIGSGSRSVVGSVQPTEVWVGMESQISREEALPSLPERMNLVQQRYSLTTFKIER